MVIEKDTILYFSGTGNSLQLAKDIRSELDETKVCKLTSLMGEKEIEVKSKVLGIVFPVYYGGMPLVAEELVKKLNISKDTYVFAVATYGGMPAGALTKLDNMLRNNNSQLNSGFLLKMPGNYIVMYNAASLEKQNKHFENAKKKVKEISNIIKERKKLKPETSKYIIDTVVDNILSKFTDKGKSKLYIKDKEFWADEKCNSCKLCEKICPVKNIEFTSNKPAWNHKCEQCMACIQHCPKEAIQWGKRTIKRKRYKNPNISINELIKE